MRGQLAFLTPAVVVLAVMMIVRKVAMEAVAFESAAVYYPLCAIFLSGAINLTVFALHSGGRFVIIARIKNGSARRGGYTRCSTQNCVKKKDASIWASFFAVVSAFFRVKTGRGFGDRQEPRF